MAAFRQTLVACLSIGILGCGANNLTAPGTTTPNLAEPNNAAANNNQVNRGTIKGTLTDALTGKPIKANLVIQADLDSVSAPEASASTASASPSPKPSTKPSEAPTIKGKSDDKGNYELKGLPDGPFSMTISAANYQAVTLSGIRNSALDLGLYPQKASEEVALKGAVKLPNQKPAILSRVASSFKLGLTSGDSASGDKDGAFDLKASGKISLAAFSQSRDTIVAFSYLPDVTVAKDKKNNPTMVLRAVANPTILSGDVETKEGMKPQKVQVYLTTDNGEIPILTRSLKDKHFRVSLPELPEDTAYHLAIASTKDGETAFSHLYKVTDSNTKISLAMLGYPTGVEFDGTTFKWDPSADANCYRVRVEEAKEKGKVVWEGYTNGTRIDLPELSEIDKNKDYRYTLTAIKVEGDWTSAASGPWSASASRAPADLIFTEKTKAKS